MDAPNEFQPLMDSIFREKVLRARQQSISEKIVGGLDLFEEVLVRMRGGIRAQFPQFDEEQVEAELYRRIEVQRRLKEHGFFTSNPPS